MGLLFNSKTEEYLIVGYRRASETSRRCPFLPGPASDDGRVRMRKRKGHISRRNSAGWGAISGQFNGPTSRVTSKRESDLVFIFE